MLPYDDLLSDLRGLYEGERDPVANAANTAATIWQHVPDINWAGFYFIERDELVLGPFYGKPTCVWIPMGKGVCGTAAAQKKTVVVPDVHKLPDHVACDSGRIRKSCTADPQRTPDRRTGHRQPELRPLQRGQPRRVRGGGRRLRGGAGWLNGRPAPARGAGPQHRLRYGRRPIQSRARARSQRRRTRDGGDRGRVRIGQIRHRARDHTADRLRGRAYRRRAHRLPRPRRTRARPRHANRRR